MFNYNQEDKKYTWFLPAKSNVKKMKFHRYHKTEGIGAKRESVYKELSRLHKLGIITDGCLAVWPYRYFSFLNKEANRKRVSNEKMLLIDICEDELRDQMEFIENIYMGRLVPGSKHYVG